MRDKEPIKRIEALKSKKKQTATMKRRALKPKNTIATVAALGQRLSEIEAMAAKAA